jgi:quinol monooxygenase YgiN
MAAPEIGILALIEAKPGKGPDLRELLKSARAVAAAEEGTVTWYAFKVNDETYGIFDTFDSEDSRIAHINGEIPKVLTQNAELLAKEPDIQTIDIVAVK